MFYELWPNEGQFQLTRFRQERGVRGILSSTVLIPARYGTTSSGVY